jgi:hypothetical protein
MAFLNDHTYINRGLDDRKKRDMEIAPPGAHQRAPAFRLPAVA